MDSQTIKNLTQKAREETETKFPFLGVNKKRELTRLIFEIAKARCARAQDAGAVLPQDIKNFEQAKRYLLQKRYPRAFANLRARDVYLPKLDLDFTLPSNKTPRAFYPKVIYADKEVFESPVFLRAQAAYPNAQIKFYENGKIPPCPKHYSQRTEVLVISKENFDFIKPCPCTSNCVSCGYNLINLGFGCAYECAYCYLQQYQNLHAVVLPANINNFLAKIAGAKLTKGIFPYIRIGSGEFTDSLLFDDITRYSGDIVNFFRGRSEYFEFKTKSVNIDGLLSVEAAPNIVAGWSVNPPQIIKTCEFLTPPLEARLEAAAKLARRGYKTAFHFDPIILHEGWRQNYAQTIKQIAQSVPQEAVVWISAGTLRFHRELKRFIETRFADNTILDEEFLLDFDGKLRYPAEVRKEVYCFIMPLLQKHFPNTYIYMCMESAALNKILPQKVAF